MVLLIILEWTWTLMGCAALVMTWLSLRLFLRERYVARTRGMNDGAQAYTIGNVITATIRLLSSCNVTTIGVVSLLPLDPGVQGLVTLVGLMLLALHLVVMSANALIAHRKILVEAGYAHKSHRKYNIRRRERPMK